MQKKLFCLLLASSMLTPSFSILANENLEEEVMNESNTEDQFEAFQEEESLEAQEVSHIWIRYQENGKTLKIESPIQFPKDYSEDSKPALTDKIKDSDFVLYETMLKCIPHGYDFVQSKADLEATPWSVLESVTAQMKSDREAQLKDLDEEVRNQLPKVEDGDFCWTIPIKKWDANRNAAQTISSDLPIFLGIVTQIGDDGNGTTWWTSTTIFIRHAKELNLDSSEAERLTALNKVLDVYSYKIEMNKPIAKSDLVEIKAGSDVVAYTSKSEYIDLDAKPFSFKDFGGGTQDTNQDKPLEAQDITVEFTLKNNAQKIEATNLQFKAYLKNNTKTEIPNCTFKNAKINSDGSVNVDVTILEVKGSYATSNITQASATMNPSVPVQKWVIQFNQGETTKGTYSIDPKASLSDFISIDEYIPHVPKGCHLTRSPSEVYFASAAQEEIVAGFKSLVMKLEVVQDGASLTKNADDSTIIKVPYRGENEELQPGNILEFKWSEVPEADQAKGKISAEFLKTKLNVGTTESTVSVSDMDAIYYGDSSTEVYVFSYTAKTPIIIKIDSEENKTLADVESSVTVQLPEGLASIELPLKDLAQDASDSTWSYTPNYKEIAKKLDESLELDKKAVDNGKKPPKYKFVVEKKTNVAPNKDTQNANASTISLADLVDIKISFIADSLIRLLLPTTQNNAALVRDFEEMTEASQGTVGIVVKVSDVADENMKVTSASIAAYLNKKSTDEEGNTLPKDIQVPPYFNLDLSKPQPYNQVEDGYFQAEVVQGSAPASSTGGSHKKPTAKPEEPAQSTTPSNGVGTPTSMYRLYNKLNGEHLFTTNKAERDALLESDTWKDEGQGWTAPSFSDFPVYRLLNPNTGDHHYTTDKNEFETLPNYGWIAEGVAFFSADADATENVILHRLYNPNQVGAGSHHYTADENERDTLVAQGWKYEGTAWAGLKTE